MLIVVTRKTSMKPLQKQKKFLQMGSFFSKIGLEMEIKLWMERNQYLNLLDCRGKLRMMFWSTKSN